MTQWPTYFLFLEGSRVARNPMFNYLIDFEEAKNVAHDNKIPIVDVIENRMKVLENVIFRTQGNFYLTDEKG